MTTIVVIRRQKVNLEIQVIWNLVIWFDHIYRNTWCIQVLRSPNFIFSSGMEAVRNVKVVGDGMAVL